MERIVVQAHLPRAASLPYRLLYSWGGLQRSDEPCAKEVTLVFWDILAQFVYFRLFESVVRYFDAFLTLIPLSFVLGFYVSFVASRWWQQFLAIPWPDKLYHSIALYIPGYDEESRMLRRCLIRWMNLALILVLRSSLF